MSSVRVSLVEGKVDPKARATKKVKPRDTSDIEPGLTVERPQGAVTVEKTVSFREALLNVQGSAEDSNSSFEDWNDADLPENRWYKDIEEPMAVDETPLGGIPEVKVTDKELAVWSKEWDKTLVVNVLGKKVNYRMIENKAKRDWARSGSVKVIDMPRGFLAVHFGSNEDYKHALFEGPWMIADHYLLVQRWRPNFLNSAKKESKVAVWVRIPELPLELYNKTFLERVGNALGSFLKMDHLTSIQSRGQFARFCTEIDLAKPLLPFVMFRGAKVKLEFEGLHAVCFKCGVYGHRAGTCLLSNSEVQAPVSPAGEERGLVVAREKLVEEDQKGQGDVTCPTAGSKEDFPLEVESRLVDGDKTTDLEVGKEEDTFGPWMLVRRSKKKKVPFPNGSSPRREVHGNRPVQSIRPVTEIEKGLSTVKDSKARGNSNLAKGEKDLSKGNKDSSSGPSNGPLFVYKDQAMEEATRPQTTANKVKRPKGGKNPQLGPRLRDTKKATRSIGTFKKSLQLTNGLGYLAKKENVHPNVNKVGKGKMALIGDSDLAGDWNQKDTKKKSIGNNSSNSIGLAPPKEVVSNSPVIDANPLLGFIEHIDMEACNATGVDPQKSNVAVSLQQGSMLSEHQNPHLSK